MARAASGDSKQRGGPSLSGSAGAARRRGRPPQVTRAQIVDAISGIPPSELTIARVATALGVSASGLYHHVKGREALLEIAAEAAADDLMPPADTGQHWSEWWLEYCRVVRAGLKLHPDVLQRMRVSHPGFVERLEAMLSVLHRSGFGAHEARCAIDAISNWLYGFVWREVQVANESETGHPPDLELARMLRERSRDALPQTRRIVREASPPDADQEFVEQLWLLLTGLAARRGETLGPPPEVR